MSGELDRAVAFLAEASQQWSSNAGLLLVHARARIVRADGENAIRRVADATAALQLALAARSDRRRWHGDSVEAVATGCRAAFVLGDYETVVRLGSAEQGEATLEESGPSEIRNLATMARLILDRGVPEARSDYERELFAGLKAGQDPLLVNAAVTHFRAAVRHASDAHELEQVHRQLARIGRLVEDRLDELPPDRVVAIRGLALLVSGDVSASIELLRPVINRDRFAATVFAEALVADDRPNEAVEHLERASRRFSEPTLVVAAVEILVRSAQISEARNLIDRRIGSIPAVSTDRCYLRKMAIELAAKVNDLDGVIQASIAAEDDGCADEGIRWAKAEALMRKARFDEAWIELREPAPATIPTEELAAIFLNIAARSTSARLADVLDLMDLFPESEIVVGLGLLHFYGFGRKRDPSNEELLRLVEHSDRFFDLYPESDMIRRETVPTDPDELDRYMQDKFRPSVEEIAARRHAYEMHLAGGLPLGSLADSAGGNYLDLALSARQVPFPASFADPGLHDDLVETATRGLSGEIVVDLSALVVAGHVRYLWRTAVASCGHLVVPLSAVHQVDFSLRSPDRAGRVGWIAEADTWTLAEAASEVVAAERAHLEWLQAQILEIDAVSADPSLRFDRLEGPDEELAWLDSMRLASANDSMLWCDDLGLLRLARSLGLRAVNSLALYEALESGAGNESVRERFFALGIVDLPLEVSSLFDLAESGGWEPIPTQIQLSRPAIWQDPMATLSRLEQLFRSTSVRSAEYAAGVAYAASAGLVRATAIGNRRALIASVFVTAFVGRGATAEDMPALLGASRAVGSYFDVGDPLAACGQALWDVLDGPIERDSVGRVLLDLAQRLDPEDRSVLLADVIFRR